MEDKFRAITNMVKDILAHGYGSLVIVIEHGNIVCVEEMKKKKI